MILGIFLAVIVFVIIAMLWGEGMWANALTLANTIFAVLIAMNVYGPVADYIEELIPSFTYAADFIAVWLVFAAAFNVLRILTDLTSKHHVRFKMPIEHTGRILFAVATAWVMICFITTTLHMAPLARNSFRGGFGADPMPRGVLGLAPDRMLLGFLHTRSKGALATSPPNVFDPQGEFIFKYGGRRTMLEEHNNLTGSIRVKPR